MNNSDPDVFVYLLIDNGMLNEESANYTEADSNSRPAWLAPIYADRALEVSPLLVDVEAAYVAGDLDQVMGYLNACKPALHVSIIESRLPLEQIAQHLRRFIFILDPEGKQFTLRFADCAVLASLSSVLTPAQWATMSGPITRWEIHDRSGAIIQLPQVGPVATVPTPLCLDREQVAALDEASEPDHYVAKAKMMRHGAALPGNPAEHHAWAQAARQVWRTAGSSNPLMLTFLTEAALVTEGEVLRRQEVRDFLAMDEASAFRSRLRELVAEIQDRPGRDSRIGVGNEKLSTDAFFI